MTSSQPRILVTDAVPMNGGDELLLRALLRSLERRWPSCQITVLTHDVTRSRALMPDVHFEGDVAAAPHDAHRLYARADLVISTPGGFLSRHYGLDDRLAGFRLASAVGRPLVLFAQSIGPFGSDEERRAVGEALRGATLVAVRDAVSRSHLAACGLDDERVVEVADAAFLWPARGQPASDVMRPARRVGLCLRRWPRRDDTAFRETIRKARRLMRFLAMHGVEAFVFASTCQGVEGYTDDADLSRRVVAGLEPDLASRTVVHERRLHPDEYMDVVGACDLFIGMRLHGCLMAMLASTPALGLAYETKTPEIFGQMGMRDFQVPFTAPSAKWCRVAGAMLQALPLIREGLPQRVREMQARASTSLDLLDEVLRRQEPQRSGALRHANSH
jgi:colanic acid/amylovoran biosynthesis protein